MSPYVQRVLLFYMVLSLAACSGVGGGAPSPAANSTISTQPSIETVLDTAPAAADGHAVVQKLSIRPDASSPALLMNFVSDGPAQGGVPCISCVNGAQTNDNVGLTGPSSYVPKGATWQYSLSFTDINVKGKCKLAWAITHGAKTIDSFSATINLTSTGGFILYAFNRNRPSYSGSAVLTGKATCGVHNGSLSAPLYFQ